MFVSSSRARSFAQASCSVFILAQHPTSTAEDGEARSSELSDDVCCVDSPGAVRVKIVRTLGLVVLAVPDDVLGIAAAAVARHSLQVQPSQVFSDYSDTS